MSESSNVPATGAVVAQSEPSRERAVADAGSVGPPGPSAMRHGVLLAIAFAALLIVGWQWYDSRVQVAALKEELARRLADAETRNKQVETSTRESGEKVRELGTRVDTLEGGLAESQNHQVALEALYQQLSRNSDEWALAEIEQTLTIAQQQLQLAGNVKAAILALQNADMRLQRLDRPQLAPLRKVIDRDVERLRIAPHVDIAGLALKIDGLVGVIDTVPVAMQQRPPPQAGAAPASDDAGVVARLAREFWQDLRALVRIQVVDTPEVPLLDPQQAFFLRENLKLRLLSARIAMLQRDERTYRADLLAARQWFERFFDTRDRNQAAMLATLKQLADVPIGIDVPDITASLKAVRDYKLTREKAAR